MENGKVICDDGSTKDTPNECLENQCTRKIPYECPNGHCSQDEHRFRWNPLEGASHANGVHIERLGLSPKYPNYGF